MATTSAANDRNLVSNDSMAQRVPGGAPGLAHVSDDELLAHTRRLVGKSNQLLAALLLHLAEIEARGAHRSRRCASLYTYCIYELRFSEDAAARRSAAARFAREFPVLLDAVAAGELHLTGLLMIGPHLTIENHIEVLARARFRTKKELGRLVRDLNPLPSAPDVIEPLGPALARRSTAPTWEQFAAALAPEVRELPAGERPRDWAKADHDNDGHGDDHGNAITEDTLPVGPVPEDLPPITGPQLYQVQFGTVEEHVELVERAKALLARTRPEITLGELHFEAMKLLVAALEKRRFAVSEQPRQRCQRGEGSEGSEPLATAPCQRGEGSEGAEPLATVPRQRGEALPNHERLAEPPRRRGRYVAAAVRREVYWRDGARCTYVDARGLRCAETRYLELHHLQPFAKNGAHVASNLTLRCTAHNALAAEEDFGKDFVAERRCSIRHEAFARHEVACGGPPD